jgi:hypothetical protein
MGVWGRGWLQPHWWRGKKREPRKTTHLWCLCHLLEQVLGVQQAWVNLNTLLTASSPKKTKNLTSTNLPGCFTPKKTHLWRLCHLLKQVLGVQQARVNLGRGLVAQAHHKDLSRRVTRRLQV